MTLLTGPTIVVMAGVFDLAFAAFHLAFWQLFGWPARLKLLDPINRPLLPVMNIALILLFCTTGIALISAPLDALTTGFGRIILIGVSFFWLVRAIIQIWYYRLRHPASLSLFALFIVGSLLHAAAVTFDV